MKKRELSRFMNKESDDEDEDHNNNWKQDLFL